MPTNQALIEDLLKLGENILGNLLGARHEMGAQAREKLGRVAQKLDLVSRDEFDAAMAMISKARLMQEELNKRLTAVETKLNLSSAPKSKNRRPQNLRSVKQGNRRKSGK